MADKTTNHHATGATLLIELGVAELPTAAVEHLSQALLDGMMRAFDEHNIAYQKGKRFATARRLAVQFEGVADKQADHVIEKRGPALKVAQDSDGNWTKAAINFAASFNTTPEALTIEETPKGKWLYYHGTEQGKPTTELIPTLFNHVLEKLPIAKRMRWGDGDDSFMRPVLSLVMLWNDSVIDTTLFGIASGRTTIGHRFHGEKTLVIQTASDYENTLKNSYVLADIDQRRDTIVQQVKQCVSTLKQAHPVINDSVLDEVNALVEHPVAILGEFNPRYLDIPQEVLIKTMQDNQKYFAVVDDNGVILPYFVTIANIASQNPEIVKIGNQRVIEPRFADAEFFWNNDRKKSLASRRDALKQVVYQEKLGSIYDRSERIGAIARFIAEQANANSDYAERAAQLAKCDLISEMVFEFGELQGIMGEYYAKNDGEPAEVASAIREHYLPKFAGDALPDSETGLVLSLADKIENIVGGFAVGAKPTGTKDPYALRRASLGVIRLLNETALDLSLETLLSFAVGCFDTSLNASAQLPEITTYIHERLKGYYMDKGNRHDVFDAVMAVNPPKLKDFTLRMNAVTAFFDHEAADNLFAANKRIGNILKKNPVAEQALRPELLTTDEEKTLYALAQSVQKDVQNAVANSDYTSALSALATLNQPLGDFFDNVRVMSEDADEQANRLTLLRTIRDIFMQVADFSAIDASQ